MGGLCKIQGRPGVQTRPVLPPLGDKLEDVGLHRASLELWNTWLRRNSPVAAKRGTINSSGARSLEPAPKDRPELSVRNRQITRIAKSQRRSIPSPSKFGLETFH